MTHWMGYYWSDKFVIHIHAAVSCALDLSYFAIVALIPKSKECLFKGDGIILVFSATDPIPVASWSVTKVLFIYKTNCFYTILWHC